MPKWIEKWKVPRSSGEGTWTVSKAEDGSWGCSCPRWIFKREQCHHILAVQNNAAVYAVDNGKSLPEIVPGKVAACTITKKYCLHPLIPLDHKGTGVLATIVYDLLKLGYSFGFIKKRFRMIPREWTVQAITAYIEERGRTLCPVTKKEVYRQVPA